jgi:hypothetical protein
VKLRSTMQLKFADEITNPTITSLSVGSESQLFEFRETEVFENSGLIQSLVKQF